MRRMSVLWLMSLAALFMDPVHASDWPARPIRIIVPYSAGGAVDILTRLIARGMSQSLQPPDVRQPQLEA